MKKHLFLAAALAAGMALNAQYTQELPLDYNDFFRAEAIAEDGNHLERDAYTSTTQDGTNPVKADQWNNGGKSGENAGANPVVQANTLSYGSYVDNKAGKEIVLANIETSSATRASIYSLTNGNTLANKAYYLAALVNISAASGSRDILAIDGNYTANAQRARFYANKSGSGYTLGLGWNATPTKWSEVMDFETTHLIVIRITTNSSDGKGNALFYLDPDLDAGEAGNVAFDSVAGDGLKVIRGITIRQRNGVAGKIAGLRFGSSWADVVKKAVSGLPALDAPTVGAASAIGAEEFTANWTAVENAVGYKVNVYRGETVIANKTVGAEASATFYNMPVATELTYTVTAIGDGENYDNSEVSAASAAFTTLAAPATIVFIPSAPEWEAYAKEKGAYAAGSFPTTRTNGFDFVESYIETTKEGNTVGIDYAATGERFTARVVVDKQKNSSNITLPAVASAARVDIYMNAGSDGKKIEVYQFDYAANNWVKLQELSVNKALEVYSVIPHAGVVKLRIINPDTSTKYIWKVVTYAATPTTLAAPVVGDATEVKKDGFTANWAAVANATGYRVLVTSADTTIRANVDAEVVSMTIDKLKPNTEYTVKVAAIGDDAAYVGSVLSEAKVVTTLSDTTTAIGEVKAGAKARKVVIDGQMLIERNGEYFNMTGAKVL